MDLEVFDDESKFTDNVAAYQIKKTVFGNFSKSCTDTCKFDSVREQEFTIVFILGKSGSGKSPLHNILCGIDSAISDEILVERINLISFNHVDFDNDRNEYVGFVFQEFNLLGDFNVRYNVSIALQLSKEENVSNKVKKAFEQVELSADYITRRISSCLAFKSKG